MPTAATSGTAAHREGKGQLTFVPSSPGGHLCGELLFHAADLSDRLGSWVDLVWSKQVPALKLYASHPAHSIKGSPSPALVGVRCGHTPIP